MGVCLITLTRTHAWRE